MRINQLDFEKASRFDIPESALEAAAKSVRIWHELEKGADDWHHQGPKPTRSFTLTRAGESRLSHYTGESIPLFKYRASIVYDRPIELTQKVAGHEYAPVEDLTELLRNSRMFVRPADLQVFPQQLNFTYAGVYAASRGQDVSAPFVNAEIEIQAYTTDLIVRAQLANLSNSAEFPTMHQGRYWMGTGSRRVPSGFPRINLTQLFVGDMDPSMESRVSEWYNAVNEVVGNYELIAHSKVLPGGLSMTQEAHERGFDLQADLARTTAGLNGHYAPHLSVIFNVPTGAIRYQKPHLLLPAMRMSAQAPSAPLQPAA